MRNEAAGVALTRLLQLSIERASTALETAVDMHTVGRLQGEIAALRALHSVQTTPVPDINKR